MNKVIFSGLNITLLLFSCLLLVIDRVYGAMALLLMLLSAFALLRDRAGQIRLIADEKLLLLGLCAYPLVVTCGMLLHRNWQSDQFDHPSRFLLILPIFFAMRRFGASRQLLYLGLMLGAVGAGSLSLYQVNIQGLARATGYINAIQFGNLSLMLGLLALTYCIRPRLEQPLNRLWVSGSVLAFCFGLIGSAASGTRGGWLALPLLLWLILREAVTNKPLRFGIYALFIAAALMTYSNNPQIQHRVDSVASNVTLYFSAENTVKGSAGLRFEKWRAAAIMFTDAPLIGVGMGQYETEINELIDQQRIHPSVGVFGHAHNELLQASAELGILGTIGLLALYGLLIRFFLQHRQYDRQLAFAGIVLVLGFIDMGLTQALFKHSISTLFLALYSAVLAGLLCHQRVQQSQCTPANALKQV